MAAGSVAPLIVIAGPTASGKTSLAIELAGRYDGEIICADSRTVYRGMDIGTAKPTVEERRGVPHWGLDLVEPGESFSAADFQGYAQRKIDEIRARGRVPFLVGGTGLYVDTVIFDFGFGGPVDPQRRQQLAGWTTEQLQQYCCENNINILCDKHNRRHLQRLIERQGDTLSRRATPINHCFIVGITTKKAILRRRIEERAEHLLSDAVVNEATLLGKKYGWWIPAMTGNVYPLIRRYLCGEINNDELKRQFILSDWHLAKRQLTWLRRNPYIVWGTLEAAEHYLSELLARR